MKKTLALLMALMMALAVCGCAENLPKIEIPPIPQITDTPQPQIQTEENEGASESEAAETPLPAAEETPAAGEELPLRILVQHPELLLGTGPVQQNTPDSGGKGE